MIMGNFIAWFVYFCASTVAFYKILTEIADSKDYIDSLKDALIIISYLATIFWGLLFSIAGVIVSLGII